MLAFIDAHPFLCMALLVIVTALANWSTAPEDPAEWERIKREEPRRAGAILVLRGFGVYPAKILRGLSMIFPRRPPGPPAVLACLMLAGCAGTFELPGPKAAPVAIDPKRCAELDDSRVAWGASAKGSGVLAGASAATAALPLDRNARIGVAIGALVAGAFAAFSVTRSEGAAASWVRECAH